MTNYWLFFRLVGSLTLAALTAAAQLTPDTGPAEFGPGNLRLHGRVQASGSNTPIAHARIELRTFTGMTVGITSSDSNGDFTIPGLQTGNYVIQVEQQGFRTSSQNLEINSMEGMMDVTLTLQPAENNKPSAPDGAISARHLKYSQRAQDAYAKGINELYDKKNPTASLPDFELALKEAPDFYEARFQTGVAYRSLARNEDAEAAFRKTIELSKGHCPEANFRLASVLVDAKKYSEAVTVDREGLAAEPDSWLGNFELGRALVALDKPDEAEKSLRKSLAANPELAKAYLVLANIHMARKDAAAEVEDLDNYLRIVPQGPQSDQARRVRDEAQRQIDPAKKDAPVLKPPR